MLIHGLASTGQIWLQQIRVLRLQYRVFVVDLPGHGRSDRWAQYSFQAIAATLAAWMQHCQIERASLLALSLGCTVALTLASHHPDRVAALLLEGPVAGYGPWWHPWVWEDWIMFKGLPYAVFLSFLVFGRAATAQWLNSFGVRQTRTPELLKSIQLSTDFRAVRQLLQASAYPPYMGHLWEIVAPTLLLRGQDDPMPRRFVTYIQSQLAQASLIEVPHTRHIVALENPEVFNRWMLTFLSDVEDRSKPVHP